MPYNLRRLANNRANTVSKLLTDYLVEELQAIQGLVYASQVFINLQLRARPEQAPHILLAVNKLNPILSVATMLIWRVLVCLDRQLATILLVQMEICKINRTSL
jgi:hypothetical protein